MIRVSSRMLGPGTGRATAALEHINGNQGNQNKTVGQMAKEKFEAEKAERAAKEKGEEVTTAEKAQATDCFEKAKEEMRKAFETYSAMGVKRVFIGGQLYSR